jgi:hypothetical protein
MFSFEDALGFFGMDARHHLERSRASSRRHATLARCVLNFCTACSGREQNALRVD